MTSSEQIFGVHRRHFTQVDSTNAEAKRIIDSSQAQQGLVITTDLQTQGRGQYGRTWESQEGLNVMMTAIISPHDIKIRHQFALNVFTSLGIIDVVSNYCQKACVKWPNDIYVGDKKIAGVLIQNYIQGDSINYSVIGIGLNVNQTCWPPEIPNATSLSLQTGTDLEVNTIISSICQRLDHHYHSLTSNRLASFERYRELLYRRGQPTIFAINDQHIQGKIMGIDNMGRLIVDHETYQQSYNHGEVSMVTVKSCE